MNPLLGIAHIAKRYGLHNTVKSLAATRNRQYNRKWAKEKTTTVMVAIESTDEDWDLGWDLN